MIIDTENLTEESFTKLKTIVRVAGQHYWGSPATKDNKLNEAVAKGLELGGYNVLAAQLLANTPKQEDEQSAHSQLNSTGFVRNAVRTHKCPHCNVSLDVEHIACATNNSCKMTCSECELTLFVTHKGRKSHVLVAWMPNDIEFEDEQAFLSRNCIEDKKGTVSWVHDPASTHPWFVDFTNNLVSTGKPIFLPNGELNPDEMVMEVIQREQDIDTPEQIAEVKEMYEEQGRNYVYRCPKSGVTMDSDKAPTENDVIFSTVVTVDGFSSKNDPAPVAKPLFGWAMTECGLYEPK